LKVSMKSDFRNATWALVWTGRSKPHGRSAGRAELRGTGNARCPRRTGLAGTPHGEPAWRAANRRDA
jgi:hypothetical protein